MRRKKKKKIYVNNKKRISRATCNDLARMLYVNSINKIKNKKRTPINANCFFREMANVSIFY